MIEILFGESEAASMKIAKNKRISIVSDGPTAIFFAGKNPPPPRESAGWVEGSSYEVICLGFMLDIGDIQEDIHGEYRKNLIYSMLNQGQWESDPVIEKELKETANVYIQELERLEEFLEAGEEVRIWYSRSAYSLCGLYYVCSLLSHYSNKVFVVELPEYRLYKDIVSTYQSWGEIAPDQFALFIDGQKELNHVEIRRYAQMWSELVADNSPLRALINNRVLGVNEDFYDFLIWKRLTDKPVKEARLIGDLLGHYQIGIGDWWYARRIQSYIDSGEIEILEDSRNPYARIIKRK